VISDYHFGVHTGLDMLALVRRQDPGMPFILLSGTIGEERAAEAIREGASDYVMKDRLTRLPGAVRREVAAAEARNARHRLESQQQQAEERYRTTFERVPVGIGQDAREKLLLQSDRLECAPPSDDRDALIGAVGVSHALTRLTLRAQEMQLAAAQEMARIGSWTYDFATG
jgi:CheY-like chemotaxis protein